MTATTAIQTRHEGRDFYKWVITIQESMVEQYKTRDAAVDDVTLTVWRYFNSQNGLKNEVFSLFRG